MDEKILNLGGKTVKEKVDLLNDEYPMEGRSEVIDLEIEDDTYAELEKMAEENDVTVEDLLFLIVVEHVENMEDTT